MKQQTMMAATTTKVGLFAFGLVLAMGGGLTVFESKHFVVGDFLAGGMMLVGIVCMIKSFGRMR